MPKVSKLKTPNSKPPKVAVPADDRESFFCAMCSKEYKRQKGNYTASQSTLYRGNGGYIPVCNNCVDELMEHYTSALGSEAEALKRLCMKFDIYWNPEILDMCNKTSNSSSIFRTYCGKTFLNKYIGKTYDTTLDEELVSHIQSSTRAIESFDNESEQASLTSDSMISESIIRYWGTGFTPAMYLELENRRKYWLSQFPKDYTLDPGEEAILRQICNLEIDINRDRAMGKAIDKSVNSLNNLLKSMNMQPSQKKEAEDNYIPFGVEIQKFEDEHPIIEPDDDFKDVDGIRKNYITWFLGSLCKTLGVKNRYSDLFEEEIQQYTVERPSYNDEEDDMDDFFERLKDVGDSDG